MPKKKYDFQSRQRVWVWGEDKEFYRAQTSRDVESDENLVVLHTRKGSCIVERWRIAATKGELREQVISLYERREERLCREIAATVQLIDELKAGRQRGRNRSK